MPSGFINFQRSLVMYLIALLSETRKVRAGGKKDTVESTSTPLPFANTVLPFLESLTALSMTLTVSLVPPSVLLALVDVRDSRQNHRKDCMRMHEQPEAWYMSR